MFLNVRQGCALPTCKAQSRHVDDENGTPVDVKKSDDRKVRACKRCFSPALCAAPRVLIHAHTYVDCAQYYFCSLFLFFLSLCMFFFFLVYTLRYYALYSFFPLLYYTHHSVDSLTLVFLSIAFFFLKFFCVTRFAGNDSRTFCKLRSHRTLQPDA